MAARYRLLVHVVVAFQELVQLAQQYGPLVARAEGHQGVAMRMNSSKNKDLFKKKLMQVASRHKVHFMKMEMQEASGFF